MDDQSADLPRPPISETPESQPTKDHGALVELRDTHQIFKQAEVNVVEQITKISEDARTLAADLKNKLPVGEGDTPARNQTHSYDFVGTDGREIATSLRMFSETEQALTFQDPDNPNLSTTVDSRLRGIVEVDQEGDDPHHIRVGLSNPSIEALKDPLIWPISIFGRVYVDEGLRKWPNGDPLEIARRGLDFLKTATLKPVEPSPPTPPTQPAPSV